jgi:hypothetical protein
MYTITSLRHIFLQPRENGAEKIALIKNGAFYNFMRPEMVENVWQIG